MLNVIYSDIHWLHQDPRGHPENPHRLELAINSLKKHGLTEYLVFNDVVEPDDSVYSVHDKSYVNWIREECSKGFHYIDSDTYVTKDTYRVAASFSASARKASLKGVMHRENWLILPRPPGHHAGIRGRAMGAPTLGFCIFNHAAVAARTILDIDSTSKVLIVDFDAHHGNGTQEIFWREPRLVHVDIHERGIYPGSGEVEEIGGGLAAGTKINIPLEPYTGDGVYLWVLEKIIKRLIDKYRFKAIVVSAGFDSYIGDPLTELGATEKTFYAYGSFFREAYEERLTDSIIVILEGGYEDGLRHGLPSFIKGLIGVKIDSVDVKVKPPHKRVLDALKRIMLNYHDIEIH